MPIVSPRRSLPRWVRRGLAVVIAIDLFAAGGVALLHANDAAEPLSTDDAVAAFRAAQQSPDAGDDGVARDDSGAVEADSGVTVPAPTDAPGSGAAPTPSAGPTAEPTEATPTQATTEVARASSGSDTERSFRPAEGVYQYATTGHESLDALGGARHDYPAETTVTIRHAGCGVRERWQPLEDRYDERSVCVTASSHDIEWYESSRSFFGQRDTRRLVCDPGAVAFSPDAPVGTEYRHRCVDADTDARNVVTVLPDEAITIDGETIQARRIRAVSDVTGDSRAHSEIESWVHPTSGLTLRRESVLDGTSAGPSGEVRYHEEYTMQLRSLRPRT